MANISSKCSLTKFWKIKSFAKFSKNKHKKLHITQGYIFSILQNSATKIRNFNDLRFSF